MSEEEGSSFTHHGIAGEKNIFGFPHCETDRFWRRSLGLTNEKYQKGTQNNFFDECRNAFTKPKPPVQIDLLDHLHKIADFE